MFDKSPIVVCRWLLAALSAFSFLPPSSASGGETSPGKGIDIPALVRKLDQRIEQKWVEAGVRPAPPAADAEYLRRVYLDVAGVIPTAAQVRAFLNDQAPDKRLRVVDRLLESPAHVENFTRLWRDLIIPEMGSDVVLRLTSAELETWLRGQIASNVGHDRVVREIVSLPMESNGRQGVMAFDRGRRPGPIGFYLAKEARPENLAAATARTFMGIRIECAQCHDHPFARWKREEFWGLAAFFGGLDKLGTDESPGPLREVSDRREVLIPGTEKVIPARFLDGREPVWKANVSARTTLADWLTSTSNPYFARATVNRYWAHFFGVGLIDPVDDIDDKTPSHPELLDELARQFAAHGFDTRFLIRVITASRAYQLSSEGSSTNDNHSLFARMTTRALTPQQLFDSLARATGVENENAGPNLFIDQNARRAEFLSKFNRRDESPTAAETSLLQALALMNGRLVSEVTDVDKGAILGAVAEAPFLDTRGQIEAVFLATLSRPPRTDELSRLVLYVNRGGPDADRKTALADVMWALLNSGEFLFNH
jgi:hypothetical protein